MNHSTITKPCVVHFSVWLTPWVLTVECGSFATNRTSCTSGPINSLNTATYLDANPINCERHPGSVTSTVSLPSAKARARVLCATSFPHTSGHVSRTASSGGCARMTSLTMFRSPLRIGSMELRFYSSNLLLFLSRPRHTRQLQLRLAACGYEHFADHTIVNLGSVYQVDRVT